MEDLGLIDPKWINEDIKNILKNLDTTKEGLSTSEAEKRIAKYGYNELPSVKKESNFKKFINQFKNNLIIVLLLAGILSVAIGNLKDSVVIFLVIVVNGVMGFLQEYRADKAIEVLKAMVQSKVIVIRDGTKKEIPSRELVPGDIIHIEDGDKLSATVRLIEAINLQIDESSLTGESFPVSKSVDLKSEEGYSNTAFMGTVVTRGRGTGVVILTGKDSPIGKISSLISMEERGSTPLEKNIDILGKKLGMLSVGISSVLFIMVLVRGILASMPIRDALIESALTAISLAVATIPEGLPIVVLVTLALGTQILAKNNAIVRKLAAVEALGTTTFICTDKTGTLTINRMSVVSAFINNKFLEPNEVDPKKHEMFFKIGELCNNAHLKTEGDKLEIIGDPVEGALKVFAKNRNYHHHRVERIKENPFDSEKMMMSVLIEENGKRTTYIKGAPRVIISRSKNILIEGKVKSLSEADKEGILVKNREYAAQGLRALALGYKEGDSEEDIVFVGLAFFKDPLRTEVKDAIALCKKAGIKVAMITGDQKETGLSIAREAGILGKEGLTLSGKELDEMPKEKFAAIVKDVVVYYRASPFHKVKIVETLKEVGEVVAVTGDGVNDAPALKMADIGVSMGLIGTDVAREASNMVLMDDNFNTIVTAIREGRRIYDNIRKFLRYQLSTNIGAIMLMFTAIMTGAPLPLLPVQILWVNIIMDGPPAVTLSMEPLHGALMEKPPRKKNAPILTSPLYLSMFIAGIAMGLGTYILFTNIGGSLDYARTAAFTLFVTYQLVNVLNCRSFDQSIFKINFFENKGLLLAISISFLLQIAVVYVPFLQGFFHTVPLALNDWLIIIPSAFTVLVVDEVRKYFIRS
ncbi:MAG: Copper-exporting P-type ATPase B [Candidatus Methanofastidiosum methylothiophilum]|uniref:P-type Ca(2+) transporter n=1 Tax=Candidatus Methanofastidiosum methylothiophilum TaxID=1705564 RepID=A0A150J4P6_9EURY|nr:MAG: Copper-exporting P-type ATPase B [Candidatus Methanofastidiosum methylthiophilus]